MPTEDHLKRVYEPLPEKEAPDYAGVYQMKNWYQQQWLPALEDAFGPTVYNYKKSVDAVMILGKKVPLVSVESEAFGVLMLKNCTPKWTHIVPLKCDQGRAFQVPPKSKKHPENDKCHKTLWSDGKIGQGQGGGWDSKCGPIFKELQEHFDDIRSEDHGNKWARYKEMLKIVRETNKITEAAPTPKKASRSRKKPKLAPLEEEEDFQPFKKPKLKNACADEEEEAFSVHSEGSSGEKD